MNQKPFRPNITQKIWIGFQILWAIYFINLIYEAAKTAVVEPSLRIAILQTSSSPNLQAIVLIIMGLLALLGSGLVTYYVFFGVVGHFFAALPTVCSPGTDDPIRVDRTIAFGILLLLATILAFFCNMPWAGHLAVILFLLPSFSLSGPLETQSESTQ